MFDVIEAKVRYWYRIINYLKETPQFETLDKFIKIQIEKILIQMDEFITA